MATAFLKAILSKSTHVTALVVLERGPDVRCKTKAERTSLYRSEDDYSRGMCCFVEDLLWRVMGLHSIWDLARDCRNTYQVGCVEMARLTRCAAGDR
jgi:hypothetical protein